MTRPLNYTTKIPARRTASECADLLAEAGAGSVALDYTDREPSALMFMLDTPAGRQRFAMPVNVEGMRAVLAKMLAESPPHASRAELNRLASTAHARAVAWRVVRDWLAAQLAIIAAGMATLDQVMLPYLAVEGRTLYELFAESGGFRAAIEAGR
jgi:hypothetical protein